MMIEVLHDLDDRGLNIVSLTEPAIDTTTPMGRALFGVVAVFAQLRVDTIREHAVHALEQAGERFYPLELASLVHEESSMLAVQLRQDLIATGTNLVVRVARRA